MVYLSYWENGLSLGSRIVQNKAGRYDIERERRVGHHVHVKTQGLRSHGKERVRGTTVIPSEKMTSSLRTTYPSRSPKRKSIRIEVKLRSHCMSI